MNKFLVGLILFLFSNVALAQAPLRMELRNLPGGSEKKRMYVRAYFEEEKYAVQIPIINDCIPDVALFTDPFRRVTDLVLDYGKNTAFKKSHIFKDGYIHYSNDKKKKEELKPEPKKEEPKPEPKIEKKEESPVAKKSGVSRPKDDEIDDLFDKPTLVKEKTAQKIPSKKDVNDKFLKRPSTVK